MSEKKTCRHCIGLRASQQGNSARRYLWMVLLLLFSGLHSGCSSCNSNENNGQDGGKDATAEDGNGGSDGDADSDVDSDGDSDLDVDIDSDIDTDSDTDTDTDTDADADIDSGLPPGCSLITPANENGDGWTGKNAIDNNYLVWRYLLSTSSTEHVLMARELSSGNIFEVLHESYLNEISTPVIFSDIIAFSREIVHGDSTTREIFSMKITDSQETRRTSNSESDGNPMSGINFIVFTKALGLSFLDISNGQEASILGYTTGTTILSWAYDGQKWVAYNTYSSLTGEARLFKYDVQNPQDGSRLLFDSVSNIGTMLMAFNRTNHELISANGVDYQTDGADLWAWNMETNEHEVVLSEPFDQVLPDADGFVIAYADSQATGKGWRESGDRSEVKIIDQQTKVKRTVMPLDVYYGIGLWSHYLAMNNYGRWGDSIILCDLEAGGFMTPDGHVKPEGTADAGAEDSGTQDSGVVDASALRGDSFLPWYRSFQEKKM